MRISDWSSDVCSSDLARQLAVGRVGIAQADAGIELLGIADVDVLGGRAALVRDEVVLGGVHGNAVQPGIELGVTAEIPDRAVGADEGVLGHVLALAPVGDVARSEEHTSELQSLMRISYAVFCLKKKKMKHSRKKR